MVAVTSPLSPHGFTAALAVTYHRAEVSCISVTLLTHSWNMMECTYGLCDVILDGYYAAYKPITLSSILFMFVEIKFIHCHSCVMFAMKSMSRCND